METKNIYKALAAINRGIGAIEKSRKNQQQGFMFRGIDDVMNELHTLFAENEVFILPEFMNVETVERQTQRGGAIFYVKATIRFTFMASDGSSVTATIVGEAMDSGDKATNKAMSIALKYALLQMFLIPTAEDKDPDAKVYEVKASSALPEAIAQLEEAGTVAELGTVWASHPELHKNTQFIAAAKAIKARLSEPAATAKRNNGEPVKTDAQ